MTLDLTIEKSCIKISKQGKKNKMNATVKATLTAILVLGTAFSQQTAKPNSQTVQPATSKLQGRYFLHVPESDRLVDAKLMFLDTSCHKYLVRLPARDTSFSTEGFYVVKGRVVGNILHIVTKEEADEATSERVRKMLSKCPEPE